MNKIFDLRDKIKEKISIAPHKCLRILEMQKRLSLRTLIRINLIFTKEIKIKVYNTLQQL